MENYLSKLADLQHYHTAVETALADMTADRILPRIWARDHTVWRPDPTEISDRLGWLDIAGRVQEDIPRFTALRDTLLAEGYTHALLLGMGGSSLAPAVFGEVFADARPGLQLAVLDSTDPGAVIAHAIRLNPCRTLFIAATKSGRTVETLSFLKYFYTLVAKTLGTADAGEHFIAITDAGSHLDALATRLAFRETFLNDPTLGGRYSVLSYFGMVPAALAGLDVRLLLDRALAMMAACGPEVPAPENPAAWLGAVLGELALAGRDKLTLVASPEIAPFGDWIEQLVAESTGKEGKGILPVVAEPLGAPDVYGDDRLFVHLRLANDTRHDAALAALAQAGHPVVRVPLRDRYDLGKQVFLWELATAVAGARLDIQPFNQPNVESAKVIARRMVAAYEATGSLPPGKYAPLTAGALDEFLAQAQPGAYIALQAYVQPTPEISAALQSLRLRLRERTHLATTVGYGPRFLHSTGQLHKGDAGHGLFIQFISPTVHDVPIPDAPGATESSITFGILKQAQALGDAQALRDAGRRVICFDLGTDEVSGLKRL